MLTMDIFTFYPDLITGPPIYRQGPPKYLEFLGPQFSTLTTKHISVYKKPNTSCQNLTST